MDIDVDKKNFWDLKARWVNDLALLKMHFCICQVFTCQEIWAFLAIVRPERDRRSRDFTLNPETLRVFNLETNLVSKLGESLGWGEILKRSDWGSAERCAPTLRGSARFGAKSRGLGLVWPQIWAFGPDLGPKYANLGLIWPQIWA